MKNYGWSRGAWVVVWSRHGCYPRQGTSCKIFLKFVFFYVIINIQDVPFTEFFWKIVKNCTVLLVYFGVYHVLVKIYPGGL